MSNTMWHVALEPGTTRMQDVIQVDLAVNDFETICCVLSTDHLKGKDIETERGNYLFMYGGEYERPYPSVMIWRFEVAEKGNIINSVNYPALDAGDPAGTRICVLSKAIDGAADVFKGVVPGASAVVSNTRGDYAYTVIDGADASCVDAVKGVDGVIRVRVIG